MPASSTPRATRRAALVTAVAAVAAGTAVTGCDVAGSDDRDPASGASPSPTPDASDPRPATGTDDRLVLDVASESAALLALVRQARRSARVLAGRLEPLVDLHRAHLRALEAEDLASDRADGEPAPRGGARAVAARVLRQERAAARRMAAAAVSADSGALASLLASMAAGISAHLAADDLTAGAPMGRR